LTDAEIFAACEGRMARKGARAEQSGKLARVSGSGMPRPEVAARIEAALSGQLPEQAEKAVKAKRKRSKDSASRKEKSKRSKSDKKRPSDKEEKRKSKKRKTNNVAEE
ncbi:hypothetical protein GGI20_006288, partial [Coemansia sp. BCRC 34301]